MFAFLYQRLKVSERSFHTVFPLKNHPFSLLFSSLQTRLLCFSVQVSSCSFYFVYIFPHLSFNSSIDSIILNTGLWSFWNIEFKLLAWEAYCENSTGVKKKGAEMREENNYEAEPRERTLGLTPTWSVATVLTVFVVVSLIVERSIHRLSNVSSLKYMFLIWFFVGLSFVN